MLNSPSSIGGTVSSPTPPPKWLQKLKSLDIYARTDEDVLRKNSWSGVIITIVCAIFISVLFLNEFVSWRSIKLQHHLHVDTTYGEKLHIHLNITFPMIPCADMAIDVVDVSGAQQIDVEHNLHKVPLNALGRPLGEDIKADLAPATPKPPPSTLPPEPSVDGPTPPEKPVCESCYGAETTPGQCCNTCEEVQEAYRKKNWVMTDVGMIKQCQKDRANRPQEGCNVYGFLTVNRVAGYFQIGPGRPMVSPLSGRNQRIFSDFSFNLSHIINELAFGDRFPDLHNPLDNVHKILMGKAVGACKYFLKVVPTHYEYLDGHVVPTNQFSVTEHFQSIDEASGRIMPGVFFIYDLSPIMVELTEKRMSFLHFITNVCAIVGGVFTVAGMINGLLYRSVRTLRGKILLGKAH